MAGSDGVFARGGPEAVAWGGDLLKTVRHSTAPERSRHRRTAFGGLTGLCILAGILPSRNRVMLANLIEFATTHFILSGLFVIILALLIFTELQKGGQSLSSREVTALINSDQGVVVDIRNKKEFDAGHIVGALNIPLDKLTARVAELEKHKAKTIILVDAMGQQAGTAARDLKKAGFTAARLGGGIATWRGDNLPVVK
ncbi:Rhodanese-related sulfurtransferase [Pseudomonas punonensis]|uniref:Rhodanese-related sulfurtransferase n=2 Tax=Phytopseudomonas punonensis TaxID=1220495 RepID=A0A1M6YPV4_9GAMM|nr:Rhodanese-related sulfurtransferase [Pseudomonas punonensis]